MLVLTQMTSNLKIRSARQSPQEVTATCFVSEQRASNIPENLPTPSAAWKMLFNCGSEQR